MSFTSVEICAGAGGQAIGLHHAGFDHVALVELDPHACQTLRHNGEQWGWRDRVHEGDVRAWTPPVIHDLTLLAGGVPCPPFSIAGKQLGHEDERDLFPAMLDLAERLKPRGVMIENVRGLLGSKFNDYRASIEKRLAKLGYKATWNLLNASDYGVPQLRPRTILVALRAEDFAHFEWPEPVGPPPTVGQVLYESMASCGWENAAAWADQACEIAPTLVGGSKKHGGADLGPTRAKKRWAELGVDGLGVADGLPVAGFRGMPKLTVAQAALIQGFPPDWVIQGRKTAAYRQVGNAFPPPVAQAVGEQIVAAFRAADASEAA